MVRRVGQFLGKGAVDPVTPHSDLVPLGFGDPNIYVSPEEPVSPFDCERWPESPFCGGNPFSRNFMDLGVEMVRDDCNIGIDLQVTLGFTKMPHFQAVYRAPGCRGKEPPPPINKASENIPQDWGNPFKDTDLCIVFLGESRYGYYEGIVPMSGGQREIMEYFSKVSCSGVSYNFFRGRVPLLHEVFTGRVMGSATCTFSIKQSANEIWRQSRSTNPSQYPLEFEQQIDKRWDFLKSQYGTYLQQQYYFPSYGSYGETFWMSTLYKSTPTGFVIGLYGTWGNIKAAFPYKRICYEKELYGTEGFISYEKRTADYQIFGIALAEVPPDPPYRKPPPPIPSKDCECMSCCNSPKEKQNEDLLKLILKRVNDLHKKVGETDLPANVPKNLADASKGTTKVQNLAHFSAYIVQQLDAIAGQYPIEIKIKDTDLTKEGNQTQTIKLPNQAEAIAEIFGLVAATKIETDAILKATLRVLIDGGSHKQTSIQTYYLAKGISEFLAYKAKQKVVKVPFAFTPGETSIDKILKEKEVEIRIIDNADESDFKDALAPLLELAAMWKAQNFRVVNPKTAKTDLLNILRQIGAIADTVAGGGSPTDPGGEDFDAFLEKVEQGWTGTPGATDTQHPYGRGYDERPRIREIGQGGDQGTTTPS